MKPPTGLLIVACVFLLQGCDQLSPSQKKVEASTAPVAKSRSSKPPLHRFVLTKSLDEGVAFDTQTGQICRTWDWSPVGQAAKPDPNSGNVPQRKIGEFAPTCLSLYQRFPSGVDDGTAFDGLQGVEENK